MSRLSSLRDERGEQKTPEMGPTERREEVKLPMVGQRAEPNPARDEGKSCTELWEEVFSKGNMESAMARVKSNKGSAGIDGMTVDDLRPYLVKHWLEIREALESGAYKPSPVRRVEISKPDGGVRQLGIPTVIDRLIQQAIAQVLTPIFERKFSPSSYGFRPNRSAHDAIRKAQEYVQEGNEWVVDIDLE